MIAGRVRSGWLHRRHTGVYAVGHAAPSREARWFAAVLACGPGSVLSFFDAAVLWGIAADRNGPVHVTRPGTQRRAPRGVVLHHTASLPAADVRRRDGITCTAPARTLLDLAAVAPARDLERMVNEALVQRLVRPGELLRRSAGRPGAAALRALLADGPALTESEAERLLLRLLRRAGLPPPRANVYVGGFEVDAYWPEQRVVVEVDGFAFHGHRAAFERDRLRDSTLQAHRIRVVRLTWRELTENPERAVARIATLLATP